VVNPALIHSKSITLDGNGQWRYIKDNVGSGNRPYTKFFIIAVCNGAEITEDGTRFHLVPLDVMWPRSIGNWGECGGVRAAQVSTWNGGISFGTKRRPKNGIRSDTKWASGALSFDEHGEFFLCCLITVTESIM